MEDWKKSEGTFNLACDPQRASGMMQNTCVKIEHVTKRFGEDIVLQEVNLSLKTGNVYGIVGNNGSGKDTGRYLFFRPPIYHETRLQNICNRVSFGGKRGNRTFPGIHRMSVFYTLNSI